MSQYIHGYNQEEQERLILQNSVLAKYIYQIIDLGDCHRILEVGCGVGAQMMKILSDYPDSVITGIDISELQLEKARQNLLIGGFDSGRYELINSGITRASDVIHHSGFDGLVMIWVLEHVSSPIEVLKASLDLLRDGGKFYITEVFHDSFSFYPPNPKISGVWDKMINYQNQIAGDANIGIQLYPLLSSFDLRELQVRPFLVYLDSSKHETKKEQFIYWRDLIQSAVPEMIKAGVLSWDEAHEVYQEMTALSESKTSVFYYSFIQAWGRK
jgi:ubiquinone/menaquinone biosynthesis C-methylase UbiE